MRMLITAAVALSMIACSSTRTRPGPDGEGSAVAPPVSTPAPAAASGAAMEASALARETGLRYEDFGSSVLLSNASLRARFFPGNDRVSIDGRSVAMGVPARREGPSFVVPPQGVEAVRRAVAAASVPPMAFVQAPRPPSLPPVAPPTTLKPVLIPPPSAAVRGAVGDPQWTAFTGSERCWRYVVIHHSDDREGNCAKYDRVHLQKGWENGCGYHFVIGNGTMSGDGQVEVGPRWVRQIQGAHAKTPDNTYNEVGIGIVLVGDFEHGGRPTAAQYESLVNLTRWLMARYGIPPANVMRHGDCKSTACPGRGFPWAKFQSDLR